MGRYAFYSIIVPAFNRLDEIRELVQSFQQLDFPGDRFELIIVDDGSTDGTQEWVQAYRERVDFPLRLVRQENRGPGAARNKGMEVAKGDFFIFLDSDVTVPPGWLTAVDRALTEQGGEAFGGPDAHRDDFPVLLKAINYAMTSFLTTGGIRGHTRKKMGKYYPRSFNMGVARNVYERIGGFSNIRHGQDIEYSHRIIQSGARVIHIPEAYVFHKRRTTLKQFFRQVFNFGVARVRLAQLDRKLLEPVHLFPSLAVMGLVGIFLGALLHQTIRTMFFYLLGLGVVVLAASGIHGAIRYRDWRLLYLIPVVIPIQILGYGLGFLAAIWFRVIRGREDFIGFRKRYYG
ncbi:MAG: glycosyltransferase [Calditrichaeota bacterium]|nr:glycosyltransferase [Calditrichota bacterium]